MFSQTVCARCRRWLHTDLLQHQVQPDTINNNIYDELQLSCRGNLGGTAAVSGTKPSDSMGEAGTEYDAKQRETCALSAQLRGRLGRRSDLLHQWERTHPSPRQRGRFGEADAFSVCAPLCGKLRAGFIWRRRGDQRGDSSCRAFTSVSAVTGRRMQSLRVERCSQRRSPR